MACGPKELRVSLVVWCHRTNQFAVAPVRFCYLAAKHGEAYEQSVQISSVPCQ
jgi:hypothetical protein